MQEQSLKRLADKKRYWASFDKQKSKIVRPKCVYCTVFLQRFGVLCYHSTLKSKCMCKVKKIKDDDHKRNSSTYRNVRFYDCIATQLKMLLRILRKGNDSVSHDEKHWISFVFFCKILFSDNLVARHWLSVHKAQISSLLFFFILCKCPSPGTYIWCNKFSCVVFLAILAVRSVPANIPKTCLINGSFKQHA